MNITALSEYNYYLSKYWELINGKWYPRGEVTKNINKPIPPNNIIIEYLKYVLEESKGASYG